MRDRRLRGKPGVGAAQILAHLGVELREALDVHFVDDRLVPGHARPAPVVAFPVERLVDDDRLRDRGRVVALVDVQVGVVAAVGHVREGARGAVPDRALDRLRVGVDEQLGGVEPVPLLRRVRAVDAVAVALAGADPRHVAVPVPGGALGELDARLRVVAVEQAELDALGVLGEEREVRPVAVPRGAERERLSRPDRGAHLRSSAVLAAKSATSVTSPRRTVSVRLAASQLASASRGRSRRSAINSR